MRTLTYGTKTIAYLLKRAERKTLSITVEPDLSVEIVAPHSAEIDAIERVIRRRAMWILRQQRYFTQFLPRTPPRQYIGGETHLYLGRQYRLKIRQQELQEDEKKEDRDQVKMKGGYLWVSVRDAATPEYIQELLNEWYREKAEIKLRERLDICLQQVQSWKIAAPAMNIRPMTRTWGRCSANGKLTLNQDLVRAPRNCIDYVILHELCHLQYPNHKPEFYKLLATLMPDWKECKKRLERLLS